MAAASFRPHFPSAVAGTGLAMIEVTADAAGVSRSELLEWLGEQSDSTWIVALIDRAPDDEMLQQVEQMAGELGRTGADAVAAWSPISEALKSERDGLIERGIDRSTVIELTHPAVLRRTALAEALSGSTRDLVDPCQLLAAGGGRVHLYRSGPAPDELGRPLGTVG